VGRVAVINSVEIFLSSYLAVIVFKTEGWPSLLIMLATVLATAGVIFVAAGSRQRFELPCQKRSTPATIISVRRAT
jgi:hypothetical protein